MKKIIAITVLVATMSIGTSAFASGQDAANCAKMGHMKECATQMHHVSDCATA